MATDLLDMNSPGSMPAKVERGPMARVESTTESLIRFALEKGLNPTELYAILRQEREAAQLQSYNRAKGDFLEACPRIIEKKIGGGITKSGKDFKFPYADLGDIIEQAFPALRRLGFSWDFSIVVLSDNKQYERCFLRHRDGYVHTADVPYLSDSGGHMNAVQQVGSGLSYSERYALLQALGLPTTKFDADSGGPKSTTKITDAQAQSLNDQIIQEKVNLPALLRMLGNLNSLSEITQGEQLATAERIIDEKRRAMRAAGK